MTLSRQLYTLIFFISLMMGIGAFYISAENTRSFLSLELAGQTQNAADSLGLSLAPHMQQSDLAAMDTMVNALFDGGYYKSLKLTSMSGELLIERQNASRVEGVPAWFINLLPLQPASASAVITTGWKQAGTIHLTAHPGYAYHKLWQTVIEIFYFALIITLISFLLAFVVLKAILKPLNAVEHQAQAIAEREFPVVHDIPRTRELKRVVLAMNKMSAKVQQIIDSLAARFEQMSRQALYDELTGLMNRKGFVSRLETAVGSRESFGSGSLAIVRVRNMTEYNTRFGHQAGSDLLRQIAEILTKAAAPIDSATPARITGTDFVLLLPLIEGQSAIDTGEEISRALNELADRLQVAEIACIGMAGFSHAQHIGEIFANADAALSQAERKGGNACSLLSESSDAPGNDAWETIIRQSLSQQSIRLLAQPIVNQQMQPVYHEILIRIDHADGKTISPALFSAMAERLGNSSALDRHVIEQVALLHQHHAGSLAINVSGQSICDNDFMLWLEQYLSRLGDKAGNMLFELTEHALLHDLHASERLIELAHRHGAQVVMEHFGSRLSSFQTLRQLKLDCVKLDGSYVRSIADEGDNQFFLRTLCDIAHGLDIEVIAEHVENEQEFESLKQLGINAMQGYYFGEPQALD